MMDYDDTPLDDAPEERETPVRHFHAEVARQHGRAGAPGFLGLPVEESPEASEQPEGEDETAPRSAREGGEDRRGRRSDSGGRARSDSGERATSRSRARPSRRGDGAGAQRSGRSRGAGSGAGSGQERTGGSTRAARSRGGTSGRGSGASRGEATRGAGAGRSGGAGRGGGASRAGGASRGGQTGRAGATGRARRQASGPSAGERAADAAKRVGGTARKAGRGAQEAGRAARPGGGGVVGNAARRLAFALAKRLLRAGAQATSQVLTRALASGSDALAEHAAQRLPIQQALDVAVPIEVAWEQWMEFSFFPEGPHSVIDVERDGDLLFGRLDGRAGREWEAEVIDERENDSFAWRSTRGSDSAGLITFHELGERLTRVELNLDVQPVGLTEAASLSLRVADRRVEAELRRFKASAELLNPDIYEELLNRDGGGGGS